MKKRVSFLILLLLSIGFPSCEGQRAIELVKKSKVTPLSAQIENSDSFLGKLVGLSQNQTVEEWANLFAQEEVNKNKVFRWEAKRHQGRIYLVSFVAEDGRGMHWEANLSNKLVKYVNSNPALCIKYGLTRLVANAPFKISKINKSQLREKWTRQMDWESWRSKWVNQGIIYEFDGEIRNDTGKSLNEASAYGTLYVVFSEDKALSKKSENGLSPRVSGNRPWKSGETRKVKFSTEPIDAVYKEYRPTMVFVELELTASDPLGYYFDGAIERLNLNWQDLQSGQQE